MTSYERFQTDQSFRYKVISKLANNGYLFHGTNEKFNAFDSSKIKGGFRGKEGYGAYFTKEAYKAEEYGNEFIILSTSDMNIVDTKLKFNDLNITTPNEIMHKIQTLNYQLDNVRSNREYDAINNEIDNLKSYLNNKILKGVDYEDYKILKEYNFDPISNEESIYNALSFAYKHLTGNGMKSMSNIFLNMGIDGYIIDNVYVIINFEKLNNNIVKDKEYLINNIINENKKQMKNIVNINRNSLTELVKNITKQVMESQMVQEEPTNDFKHYTHFAIQNGKIINGWDYSDIPAEDLRNFKNDYFTVDIKDMGLNPKEIKVWSRKFALRNGLNPDDYDNWANPTNVYENKKTKPVVETIKISRSDVKKIVESILSEAFNK